MSVSHDSTSRLPTVAIYADPLLAPTMTFVRAQALALREFAPLFIGARRTAGLDLPEGRVIVVNERDGLASKLREVPFKVFGRDPSFFRRVQREHPVLVHAHFGPSALTALPLARWLDVPLITTFHGYDASVADRYLRRANFTAARYTVRKARLQREGRLFLAVSHHVRNLIIAQGFPAERTVVHYIGVDRAFFASSSKIPRERLVLFVASLTEQKGCTYLVRAMHEVQTRCPDAQLVIIGDGPMRETLEADARTLRGVRFLGTQPPATVKEWLARAMVFCVPSIRIANGADEGFGMVFAEAQAMGTPVVSFRSGGIGEAVADGTTGLLVDEKRTDQLAAAVLQLFNDPAMWRRMSDAGPARVEALFDLRTQTARLEALYRDVLAETGR